MTAIQEHTETITTWQIDPAHTEIEFSVRHLMISTVRGRFGNVTGTITIDEADPANSSVEAEIETASIDTREGRRDEHLRSADFFDVEKFPAMTFRSTKVEQGGKDRFRLMGELTIRDITREIVLEGTDEGRSPDPWGGQRAGFSASTTIDRRDFGLTWNQALETGGVMVSNEIKINLEIQAVRS